MGEPTIAILLKEYSLKPTPHDFCAHRLVHLWPSAENPLFAFRRQQLTQNQVKGQSPETVECSALSGTFILNVLL